MPKAKIGEVDVYYEVHGEVHGTGEPVFLVPGLGGVGTYWKPNLPAFSQRHRVIVHDHVGTGQSTHARITYSVDQMTNDLVGLMDHLRIDRAHIVGHSTGGAIGQTLAVTRPERVKSLVTYASWPTADAFFRRVFEIRRTLLTTVGPEAYVRSTPVFLYPNWWINANLGLLEAREPATVTAFPAPEIAAGRIDAILAFDRTAELHRITAPTLVLCAKDDFLTPPYFSEQLAQRIPRATLLLLERGGHCASETVLEEFNATVLTFIARHA